MNNIKDLQLMGKILNKKHLSDRDIFKAKLLEMRINLTEKENIKKCKVR